MSSSVASPSLRRFAALAAVAVAAGLLGGCAVVAVAGTAASLAVDATVTAVKITGKAAGMAVDAVLPSSQDGR